MLRLLLLLGRHQLGKSLLKKHTKSISKQYLSKLSRPFSKSCMMEDAALFTRLNVTSDER
jgi:hypothetical protein